MQDSLEDYIQLVNSTKLDTVGNLNVKEQEIPWERKRQSENYALKIVEFLIDGKLHPQVFVKSLNFISQDHYEDIVEERAVTKLCGYPLCGKKLPPMPKKQFHISTKVNKIFDITDRKLFCCNYCYQASEFIKNQIDTSPLWSRNPEDFIKFVLLNPSEILRPGVEIDHGLVKASTDQNFTSVNTFTEACLDEAEELELLRRMAEQGEPKEKKPKSILKKNKPHKIDRIEEESETEVSDDTKNEETFDIKKCEDIKEETVEIHKSDNNAPDEDISKAFSDLKIINRVGKVDEALETDNAMQQKETVKRTASDNKTMDNLKDCDIKATNQIDQNSAIKTVAKDNHQLVYGTVSVVAGPSNSEDSGSIQIMKNIEKHSVEQKCRVASKYRGDNVRRTTKAENLSTEDSLHQGKNTGDLKIYAKSKSDIAENMVLKMNEDVAIEPEVNIAQKSKKSVEHDKIVEDFKMAQASGANTRERDLKLSAEITKSTEIAGKGTYAESKKHSAEDYEMEDYRVSNEFESFKNPEVTEEFADKNKKGADFKITKYMKDNKGEHFRINSAMKMNNKLGDFVKNKNPQLMKTKKFAEDKFVSKDVNLAIEERKRRTPIATKVDNSEPSTSRKKSVRFEPGLKSSPSSSSTHLDSIPGGSQDNDLAVSEEELSDFKQYIDGLCKNMRIKLPPKNSPEPQEKPVSIDEEKMNEVIRKVNKSEQIRNHRPVLIETSINPEKTKLNFGHAMEAPKYAHRFDKVKLPEEDPNLKVVIEKVKNLNVNKSKGDDKLKEVLEKLKRRDAKMKTTILIDTKMNPEVVAQKKKVELVVKATESTALDRIGVCLLQWLTLDTYIFLHGEAKIKLALNEDTLDGYFEKLRVAELEITQQVRYMNICKKLQMRELAEEKFDGVLLDKYKERKPLPDYGLLKEEGKDMDLKVKAFFTSGVYEKDDPNFKWKQSCGDSEENTPVVLPPVDASSQNALRRKVFINSVSKYVQLHIQELDLEECVFTDVQTLVKTFRLEADNIIFKPAIWKVIGFVLIFMLASKHQYLKSKLEEVNAELYQKSIFSKHSDPEGFLRQVLNLVEHVDVYVQNYIVSE